MFEPQDWRVNHSKLALCPGSAQPSAALLGSCYAEVLQRSGGILPAGEMELINLTAERQHRCAGIKAVRAQILMREEGEWGYCCSWLPASLWKRGQRSNGDSGGKHAWYPLADWWEVTRADKLHAHASRIIAILLCTLSVIYANILTSDLNISLGKYDSWLWFSSQRKQHYHFASYLSEPWRLTEWI